MSNRSARSTGAALAIFVLAVASATCGSPPTVVPPPNPGTVNLTVSTTGSDLDQNGYTVALDGGAPQNVSPNGSLSFSGIDPGSHSLALGDVASNCRVGPSNPLSFSVQSDATSSVRFDVQCGVVIAASGGTATTPDGKARVDVPSGALADSTIISVIAAPDSLLPSPAPGYVTGSAYQYRPDGTQFAKPVQITIVYDPANVPSGASESSIRLHTVQNGQWVPITGSTVDTSLHTVTGQTTHFSIYGAVASQPGVLRVISATSGAKLDSTGYELSVDGGVGTALGINDTLDVAGLSVGNHTVQLDSVASNCTVSGSNPRTVSVPAQDTATTTFTVACSSQTGDLQVTTSTSGTNLDPDGYAVSVDSGPPQHVAINGTLTLPGLAAGSHSVQLDSVAANCTVAGANPRSVSVPDGGTASTTFDLTCSANVGNISVQAPTTGPDPDPDGYTVTLDGTLSQHVATGGSATFANVAVGTHSLELTGLYSNCTVSGANPVSVDVAFDSTSTATFDVTCAAFPGDLVVNTGTTGSNLDPDGYSVVVDSAAGAAIGINASITIPNLAAGDHLVLLDGVANNCTVTQPNPRTVTIPDGGVDTTSFAVDCSKRVGDLVVKTSTSGTNPDNSYTVLLDGGSGQSMTGTDSVLFSSVAEGSHTVTLTGVNANCSVSGSNPQTVSVTYKQTTTTTFTVSCVADVGSVKASASTTGSDLDPNGYTVTLDGANPQTIGVNGSYTYTSVPSGSHIVRLRGIAANCTVTSAGDSTQTVNVTFGTTVNAAFAVSCSPNQGSIQASNTTTGTDLDANGYSVTLDGGSAQTMATNGNTTFSNVAVGSHSVAIAAASVAPNCTVTSANPTSVSVTYGSTATASFTVSCASSVGSIQATTSSSGSSIPATYTVDYDGTNSTSIASTTSTGVTFSNVPTGSHTVNLTVPANCTVTSAGGASQSVNVTYGNTATAAFTVSCQASVGSIQATTSSSGSSIPGTYTVDWDGNGATSIDSTTSTGVTFSNVPTGSHTVHLTNVPANCSVTSAGGASQSVNVTYGNTATAAFTVSCQANVGSIQASNTTTGVDLDPDGYSVSVDGGTAQTMATNNSTTFNNVAVGTRSVAIAAASVAPNCTVTSANPTSASVTYGNTATASFTISCVSNVGSIQASATSSGTSVPANYTVQLDGGTAQTIGVNSTYTFTSVSVGSHQVTLNVPSPTCTVTTTNPLTVSVTFGNQASAPFTVSCP